VVASADDEHGHSVRVVTGDACRVDLAPLLEGAPGAPGAPWACVSNLPYNVAVPVVIRLLEDAPPVERILVMVQREVGERLAAGPGDPQYGAVSVKVAYFADAKVVGLVPPTVFVPRPKVDSALVRLDRRAEPPVAVPSADDLFALVRTGFAQRRKMLRRSLVPMLGDRTPEVLAASGIEPTARAEALGLEQWAALARSAAEAA
jgi:16S rRNA (adenine1518-N6/adenine1519-N6)-dimethyltransferase